MEIDMVHIRLIWLTRNISISQTDWRTLKPSPDPSIVKKQLIPSITMCQTIYRTSYALTVCICSVLSSTLMHTTGYMLSCRYMACPLKTYHCHFFIVIDIVIVFVSII